MEHWTSEQALSEMNAFGFSYFWHPGMVTFVRNLPQVLHSDERFKTAVVVQ